MFFFWQKCSTHLRPGRPKGSRDKKPRKASQCHIIGVIETGNGSGSYFLHQPISSNYKYPEQTAQLDIDSCPTNHCGEDLPRGMLAMEGLLGMMTPTDEPEMSSHQYADDWSNFPQFKSNSHSLESWDPFHHDWEYW